MSFVFSEIKKHIKLYFLFIKLSLMSVMEYRSNFIIGILVEICFLFTKILYLVVVYNAGVTINGFSPDYMTLYVGTFSIISAIYNGFIMENFYNIPRHVKTGSLDMLITKPISLQFILTLRQANFSMIFANLIGGITMVSIAWDRLDIQLSLINIIGYIVFIISGIIMAYAVFLFPMLISFWIVETSALIEIADRGWEFNSMPMAIYTRTIQRVGMFIIPVFAITNFPSLFLVNKLELTYIVWAVVAPIIFLILIRLFWNYAIRNYTSANM
ncbi:MAG: ABC-2 family transporter protein [Lutisporaceae bacterium]